MPVPIGFAPLLGLGAGLASIPFMGKSINSGATGQLVDNSLRGPQVSATTPSGAPRSRFSQDLRWLGGLIGEPFKPTIDAFSGYFRSPRPETSRTLDFTGATTPDWAAKAATGTTLPTTSSVDWENIFAALSGGAGDGVRVDRSLFNLQETPEEAAMLAREMAEIQRRQAEGDVALRAGWGNVQAANSAAAERARAMAAQSGEQAAAVWSQAAQQARDLAAQRAQAAGQFEGRAGIDVDPEGGASDWVSFMESQAPAERRFAERQQEMLGSDLDWMAGMAGAQGQAFAADLGRQANVMSFERAREHNLRVQDRISQERMTLAQLEQQAQIANASRQPTDAATRYSNILSLAASTGNPNLLAAQTGMSVPQAEQEIANFWKALERETLAKKVG